jgi:hypothetical protein
VRIFDTGLPVDLNPPLFMNTGWAHELKAFPGPSGSFFSDGTRLFSSIVRPA